MDITSGSESLNQSQHQSHLHIPKELAHLRFPSFKHNHPPVRNVNEIADEKLTIGQKVADKVAGTVGSWPFIITQSVILAAWLVLNSIELIFKPFDPYPFILLNLMLSFQAAYAAPFVMMSQNRQSEKDRISAESDYETDAKGEEEIRHMMEHLDHQDTLTLRIVQRLETQNERLAEQEKLTLGIVQRLEAQNERMKAQHEEMMAHLRRLDPALAEKLEDDTQQK